MNFTFSFSTQVSEEISFIHIFRMKLFSCRIPAPLREISYLRLKTQRECFSYFMLPAYRKNIYWVILFLRISLNTKKLGRYWNHTDKRKAKCPDKKAVPIGLAGTLSRDATVRTCSLNLRVKIQFQYCKVKNYIFLGLYIHRDRCCTVRQNVRNDMRFETLQLIMLLFSD